MRGFLSSRDDGLTLGQRLKVSLASNRFWLRFSQPAGSVLFVVAAIGTAYGVILVFSALNGSPEESQPSILPFVVVRPLPPAAPVDSVLEPAVMPLEQEIIIQAFRLSQFSWPASGKMTALKESAGAAGLTLEISPEGAVIASARGVVSSIETDGSGRFAITLDHGNDLQSVYGNMADLVVQTKQRVERGQVIGRAAGPSRSEPGRLLFKILSQSEPVDPLGYLPSTQADPAGNKPVLAACPSKPLTIDPASEVNLSFLPDPIRSYSISSVTIIPEAADQPVIHTRIRGTLSLAINVGPASNNPSGRGDHKYVMETVLWNGLLSRSLSCSLVLSRASEMPVEAQTLVVPTPTITESPHKTSTPRLVTRTSTPTRRGPSLSFPTTR